MSRQELVLAMLASADGHAFTPVQLQKAIFLVSRNLPDAVDEGPKFNFTPYDYGPFDSDVYSEATALKASGDAAISQSPWGSWNLYSATDEGVARGKAILANLPDDARNYIEQTAQWVRAQTFGSLVKSIYEAYPEMRQNSIFRG